MFSFLKQPKSLKMAKMKHNNCINSVNEVLVGAKKENPLRSSPFQIQQKMKPIKHLTGLFDRLIEDQAIYPTHISLYFSLFQYWNINRFQNPISITREEMMLISKIGSRATYHKCMRELNDKGYIKYEPTFNPFKGSSVLLFNFSEEEGVEL